MTVRARTPASPTSSIGFSKSYPTLPGDTVVEVVNDMRAAFNGSRIRDYVPLFVERRARAALTELAV